MRAGTRPKYQPLNILSAVDPATYVRPCYYPPVPVVSAAKMSVDSSCAPLTDSKLIVFFGLNATMLLVY